MHILLAARKENLPTILAALSITIASTAAAAWLLGPELVKAAYQVSLFRSLVFVRKELTLDQYIVAFNAMIQVAAFFGLLTAVALLHTAVVFSRPSSERSTVRELNYSDATALQRVGIPVVYTATFIAGCYLLIVKPGGTYTTLMVDDLFGFLDGAYRLAYGQVPHLDFHTPLGALAFFLPYCGLKISGTFAGSMEIASFIAASFLLLAALQVLCSRYATGPAVLTLLYAVLIIVVPMNVGEQPDKLSHAMFYNRYGWIGLTVLFLYFIEPRQQSKLLALMDVTSIAATLLFLFYLKITFFLVGLAFLPIMALVSRYNRRVALGALALLSAVIIAFELVFGFTAAYVRDITMQVESSSSVLGSALYHLAMNFTQCLMIVLAAGWVFWHRPLTIVELAFVGFVLASGIVMLNYNAKSRDIVHLLAVLLWAHETLSRFRLSDEGAFAQTPPYVPASGVIFAVLLIFVAEPMVARAWGMAKSLEGMNQVEATDLPPALRGIRVGGPPSLLGEALKAEDRLELFNKFREPGPKSPAGGIEYLETVVDGSQLLQRVETAGRSAIVLDYTNPFTFIMSMKPPRGDYNVFHARRNISRENHLPAEQLFNSVDYVLSPKVPVYGPTKKLLEELYGRYLHDHYRLRAESRCWVLYTREEEASLQKNGPHRTLGVGLAEPDGRISNGAVLF